MSARRESSPRAFSFFLFSGILKVMTLTTHSVIAAAITRPIMHSHPALIFLVGVASHYLSDAVPHWDYSLGSVVQSDNHKRHLDWHGSPGLTAFVKICLDFFLGFGIVFLVVRPDSTQKFLWAGLSVFGGVLPDLLQGVNLTLKSHPLWPLQRFHDFCHTKIRLGPYPLIGIPFQLAIFGLFLCLLTK